MKRLIDVGVLVLVVFFALPDAEARFKGQLKHKEPWAVEVTAAATNGSSTAVQVMGVKKQQLVVLGTMTIAPGIAGLLTFEKLAASISRVIIEVDPSSGGSAVVKVIQGLTEFEDPITGDNRFVYDLVSAP